MSCVQKKSPGEGKTNIGCKNFAVLPHCHTPTFICGSNMASTLSGLETPLFVHVQQRKEGA